MKKKLLTFLCLMATIVLAAVDLKSRCGNYLKRLLVALIQKDVLRINSIQRS